MEEPFRWEFGSWRPAVDVEGSQARGTLCFESLHLQIFRPLEWMDESGPALQAQSIATRRPWAGPPITAGRSRRGAPCRLRAAGCGLWAEDRALSCMHPFHPSIHPSTDRTPSMDPTANLELACAGRFCTAVGAVANASLGPSVHLRRIGAQAQKSNSRMVRVKSPKPTESPCLELCTVMHEHSTVVDGCAQEPERSLAQGIMSRHGNTLISSSTREGNHVVQRMYQKVNRGA